jgi:hypothetical protein
MLNKESYPFWKQVDVLWCVKKKMIFKRWFYLVACHQRKLGVGAGVCLMIIIIIYEWNKK